MPVDVTRPATAYRLWDNDDRDALIDSHVPVGWVVQFQAALVDGVVKRTVLLQNNTTKQVKTAAPDQVIVSDLMNVEALTVADYNQLYPQSLIEAPEGPS